MVKAKNMTLQVLVSIEKLSNILSFTGYKNMELTELFKIFEDVKASFKILNEKALLGGNVCLFQFLFSFSLSQGYYLDSKAKFEGGSGGGESVPIMIKAKIFNDYW